VKRSLMLLAVLLTLGLTAAPVFADQIFIQQSGTSPAGGDPNPITNPGSFVAGVAGSATGQNPLLIIVGVYNGVGTPTISFSGCATPTACPAATVGTYGLGSDTGTLSAGQDAYGQVGLTPQTNSESFTNWSMGDTAIGLPAPTSFSLFVFALNTSVTSSTITLDESGAGKGSYIVAYDCKDGTGSSSGCAKHGDIMDTPFTNAGQVDVVPEPASLLLFGTGLLGLAFRLRRRKA